jgi:P-type Mg2+ transporter
MTTARFWSGPLPALLEELGTSALGLSTEEATRRSAAGGSRRLRRTSRARGPSLFLHQFANPIAALLLVAAILAFFLGDRADAAIILAIVAVSGFLGFWQERKAAHAVEQLLALVRPKATVLRDGAELEVAPDEVVPGDVVLLSPGDTVPGDGRLLTASDLFVDEAALTGECFPVAKAEAAFYPALGAIVLVYVLSAEIAKRWFYRGNRDAAGVVPRSAAGVEAPLGDAGLDRS